MASEMNPVSTAKLAGGATPGQLNVHSCRLAVSVVCDVCTQATTLARVGVVLDRQRLVPVARVFVGGLDGRGEWRADGEWWLRRDHDRLHRRTLPVLGTTGDGERRVRPPTTAGAFPTAGELGIDR